MLTAKLARAMRMSVGDIELSKPITEYGMDSLVAVEVRTWVMKELKSDLSVFDMMSNSPCNHSLSLSLLFAFFHFRPLRALK